MGLFSISEIKESAAKAVKAAKPKAPKSTLKVKNDTSKGASFWVVETKNNTETMLFSGTISECRDYIYLASKGLIM